MAEERIKIPRCPDRTLADFLTEIGAKFGVPSAGIYALGNNHIGQVSTTAETPENWRALLAYDSCLVESMHWTAYGLNFNFSRGGQVGVEQKSPIYDEIIISGEQSPDHVPQRLQFVAYIYDRLHGFHPKRVIDGPLSKDQTDLLAIHQSTLERLETLNQKLILEGTEFRKRLEDDYSARVSKLDERASEDKAALEALAARNLEELAAKQAALDAELQKFEVRNNTYVRRGLRESMLNDAKARVEKFGVSEATNDKRSPVLAGILALIFFLLVAFLHAGYQVSGYYDDRSKEIEKLSVVVAGPGIESELKSADKLLPPETTLYWLWVRLSLCSIGFVSTLIYYIKWQNKWAEQHATNEFLLLQFQQDISRANWILESCLEWRKETKSAIPTELLSSITRNLFVGGSSESTDTLHPADELASALLGSASKLKLKVGENELSFDNPKKIPKVAKQKD